MDLRSGNHHDTCRVRDLIQGHDAGALVSKAAAEAGSASEELLTDAAGAALPCAAEAPALSAAMRPPAHLHSPFSSPAIQMLPAGIAEAAQRLMNGGSATVDPRACQRNARSGSLPATCAIPGQGRISGHY